MKSDLKLYLPGQPPKSHVAIKTLHQIRHEQLQQEYEIAIIDVLVNSQLAKAKKFFAIPTVIKELPLPIRRVIGDPSEKEKVLLGLELFSST